MQVGSPVGVMGLDQDMTEWYGQRPLQLGMGYRPCELLDPSIQVGANTPLPYHVWVKHPLPYQACVLLLQ